MTGLIKYFPSSHIFSAYEIGHWKPAVAFYSSVISAISALPHEAIVVEDSTPGIRAALGAGIRTIAMCPANRLIDDLSEAIAVPNLAAVGEILDAIIRQPTC